MQIISIFCKTQYACSSNTVFEKRTTANRDVTTTNRDVHDRRSQPDVFLENLKCP